jgi:spectinomycin phosphotransferase
MNHHVPSIGPVYERPADLADASLAAILRRHWQLNVSDMRYAPVGYGGYHWTVLDDARLRWFVTASRLTGAEDLADLRATMRAARELADAGLGFVVAPVQAGSGDLVIRAQPGYAITVFPFAYGVPGHWGDPVSAAERAAITDLLAALHTAGPAAGAVPVRDLTPRSRGYLELSLRERGRPWRGGPYAEAARALVAEHAAGLMAALADFDDLVAQVAASGAGLVLTHGEPHPGNLIRRGADYLLVDWDTAGLAPPERDLWWILSDSGAEADRYAEVTGRMVSQPALALYRLRWDLDDIGLLLAGFRAAHQQDEDSATGWAGLAAAVNRLAVSTGPAPEKFL